MAQSSIADLYVVLVVCYVFLVIILLVCKVCVTDQFNGDTSKDEENKLLKSSIKELEGKMNNYIVKNENQLKSSQEENSNLKTELNKIKSLAEMLEKQVQGKNEEIKRIMLETEKTEKNKGLAEENCTSLKKENEGFSRKNKILENELIDLNKKFHESLAEIEYLKSENYRINEETFKIEESASFFKQTLNAEKEKEVLGFKEKITETKKKFEIKLEMLKEEINRKNIEIESYKNDIKSFEE